MQHGKYTCIKPSDSMTQLFKYKAVLSCICGAPLNAVHGSISKQVNFGAVTFLCCQTCGSYIQSPQITVDSLANWYDSDDYQGGAFQTGSAYHNYEAEEGARRLEALKRYKRDIQPLLRPDSRVLEVGCASGTLLSILREAGHEVSGVDLSSRFADMAKKVYGLEVRVGDFTGMDWPENHFEAVVLFGTISNLQNLSSALDCIHAMLTPNGILIFNFPNSDSLVAKLYRDRFWMFAPSVSNFMTVAGCCQVLTKHGFHIDRIRNDVQRPSLGKLLCHAKLNAVVKTLPPKWVNSPLPLTIPIPGVKFVLARKNNR